MAEVIKKPGQARTPIDLESRDSPSAETERSDNDLQACTSPSAMSAPVSSPRTMSPKFVLPASKRNADQSASFKPRWFRPQSSGNFSDCHFEFAPLTKKPSLGSQLHKVSQRSVSATTTSVNPDASSLELGKDDHDLSKSLDMSIIDKWQSLAVHRAPLTTTQDGDFQHSNITQHANAQQGNSTPAHESSVITAAESLAPVQTAKMFVAPSVQASVLTPQDQSQADLRPNCQEHLLSGPETSAASSLISPHTNQLLLSQSNYSDLRVPEQEELHNDTGSIEMAVGSPADLLKPLNEGHFRIRKGHHSKPVLATNNDIVARIAGSSRICNLDADNTPSEEELLLLLIHQQKLRDKRELQTARRAKDLEKELTTLKTGLYAITNERDAAIKQYEVAMRTNEENRVLIDTFTHRYQKLKKWALEMNQDYAVLEEQRQELRKETKSLASFHGQQSAAIKDLSSTHRNAQKQNDACKAKLSDLRASYDHLSSALGRQKVQLIAKENELRVEQQNRRKVENYVNDLRARQDTFNKQHVSQNEEILRAIEKCVQHKSSDQLDDAHTISEEHLKLRQQASSASLQLVTGISIMDTASSQHVIVPDSQQGLPPVAAQNHADVVLSAECEDSSCLTELSESEEFNQAVQDQEKSETHPSSEFGSEEESRRTANACTKLPRHHEAIQSNHLKSPVHTSSDASHESMLLQTTPKFAPSRSYIAARDAAAQIIDPDMLEENTANADLVPLRLNPTHFNMIDTVLDSGRLVNTDAGHRPNSAKKRKQDVERQVPELSNKQAKCSPPITETRRKAATFHLLDTLNTIGDRKTQAVKMPVGSRSGNTLNPCAPAPRKAHSKAKTARRNSKADRYAQQFDAVERA